jgi:hypothetical protein
MLSQANHLERVKKVKVKETDLSALRDSYDVSPAFRVLVPRYWLMITCAVET